MHATRRRTIGLIAVTAALIIPGAAAAGPDGPKVRKTATLERALDRTGQFARFTTLPNGTTRIDLQGSFQHVSMARVGANGEIETFCAEHPEEARRFLRDVLTEKRQVSNRENR